MLRHHSALLPAAPMPAVPSLSLPPAAPPHHPPFPISGPAAPPAWPAAQLGAAPQRRGAGPPPRGATGGASRLLALLACSRCLHCPPGQPAVCLHAMATPLLSHSSLKPTRPALVRLRRRAAWTWPRSPPTAASSSGLAPSPAAAGPRPSARPTMAPAGPGGWWVGGWVWGGCGWGAALARPGSGAGRSLAPTPASPPVVLTLPSLHAPSPLAPRLAAAPWWVGAATWRATASWTMNA